jgi:hypothetical protein
VIEPPKEQKITLHLSSASLMLIIGIGPSIHFEKIAGIAWIMSWEKTSSLGSIGKPLSREPVWTLFATTIPSLTSSKMD